MAEGEQAVRVRIIVTGRVQGVFYRAGARDEARRLGIAGFARNEADGSVLIEAEGPPQAVERFRNWCACGPPRAKVELVRAGRIAITGDRDFVAM